MFLIVGVRGMRLFLYSIPAISLALILSRASWLFLLLPRPGSSFLRSSLRGSRSGPRRQLTVRPEAWPRMSLDGGLTERLYASSLLPFFVGRTSSPSALLDWKVRLHLPRRWHPGYVLRSMFAKGLGPLEGPSRRWLFMGEPDPRVVQLPGTLTDQVLARSRPLERSLPLQRGGADRDGYHGPVGASRLLLVTVQDNGPGGGVYLSDRDVGLLVPLVTRRRRTAAPPGSGC